MIKAAIHWVKRLMRESRLDWPIFFLYLGVIAYIVISDLKLKGSVQIGLIPDWLQAVGAFGAALLGCIALFWWQYQEGAKNRSAAAIDLIRNMYLAISTIHSSRYVATYSSREELVPTLDWAVDKFIPKRKEHLDTSIAQLKGHLVVADELFGSAVSKPIILIANEARKIKSAYSMLEKLKEEAARDEWMIIHEDWQQEVYKNLETIGLYFRDEAPPLSMGLFDELSEKLDKYYAVIREELGSHILGSTKTHRKQPI